MEKDNLSPIASGIMQGLKEAIAYVEKKNTVGIRVSKIEKIEPKEIRRKLNMSQQEFSKTFCIPIGTLRNWEQGRRQIDATSAAYLRTISKFPNEVKSAQISFT